MDSGKKHKKIGGISTQDLHMIMNVMKSYPDIHEVILFGSRAKGNFKSGSDIDIALKGDLDDNILFQISDLLNEELPLPWFFDILIYHRITKKELIDHIDRFGINLLMV